MERIEKTVFISYRRNDISWALNVYQYLTSQKYDVFFDYTSIPSGDFEQNIISNIKARAHFILILTPTALDRCNEPGDWLRREIETAIDERRNIVPLFFREFGFGATSVKEKLTGKLEILKRYNGLKVHEDYFDEAMDRLRKQFLNKPLNTVLHPVSTEVQKVVREEQVAADKALEKIENDKELLKPTEEESPRNLRFYGLAASILIIGAVVLAGINAWIQKSDGNTTPTVTNQVVTNTIAVSVSAPVNTATVEIQTSTPTEEPTLTATLSPTDVGTMISPKDGMTLRSVPAGIFTMGRDNDMEPFEGPLHTVRLNAFWIDQTEVTNAMYAKCVQDNVCDQPSKINSSTRDPYYGNSEFDDFPVIYVSWFDASTYCSWAERRLPTEAEWEKAARGSDGRSWPWGETVPDSTLLNYNNPDGDTTKVGSYLNGESPFGALDMSGNVWEWVQDWYSATYYRTRTPNPPGPESGVDRVLRGGWWGYEYDVRTSDRYHNAPSISGNNIGFRCAMSETP